MKHLKSIFNLILEGVKSYNWEFDSESNEIIKYDFIDDDRNEYKVEFINISNEYEDMNVFEVSYFVKDGEGYSVTKLTGSNPYRITQTVLGDILPDFTDRYNWVDKIVIKGVSKDLEKSYISQRTKMYNRFLERNPISGFNKTNIGNIINLVRI